MASSVLLEKLNDANDSDIVTFLKLFYEKHSTTQHFDKASADKCESIVRHLFMKTRSKNLELCRMSLQVVRVLSRDVQFSKYMDADADIKFLVSLAVNDFGSTQFRDVPEAECHDVSVEAEKCLCNIFYQCRAVVHKLPGDNELCNTLFGRLKEPGHLAKLPLDHQTFYPKILFVVTAVEKEVAALLIDHFSAIERLTEYVDYLVDEASSDGRKQDVSDRMAESLKTLHALTSRRECLSDDLWRRVSDMTCRVLAMSQNDSSHDSTRSDVVNLLTNVPGQSVAASVESLAGGGEVLAATLLAQMKRVLDPDQGDQNTTVVVVLVAVGRVTRWCRPVRRRLFHDIITDCPLADGQRPDQGDQVRHRLSALMMSANTNVAAAAGEVMFMLCKANKDKVLRHVGLGYAAGYFANHGLLGANTAHCEGNFSSDSEQDDDDDVDLVTGQRGAAARPDPLEGMSEEQKEELAEQLACDLHRLQQTGVVQLATEGSDGTPRPLDHVLQLLDNVDIAKNGHNSDSD